MKKKKKQEEEEEGLALLLRGAGRPGATTAPAAICKKVLTFQRRSRPTIASRALVSSSSALSRP